MKPYLLAALLLLLAAASSFGAEKALILDDAEQQALVQILDAATRSQGLAVAPMAVRLWEKLKGAPIVTGSHVDEDKK